MFISSDLDGKMILCYSQLYHELYLSQWSQYYKISIYNNKYSVTCQAHPALVKQVSYWPVFFKFFLSSLSGLLHLFMD